MRMFIILSFFLGIVSVAEAEKRTPFDLAPVNFWEENKVYAESATSLQGTNTKNEITKDVPASDTLWSEPMVTPDGKISVYTPPKEVKDFLDNPTEETGKIYLNWSMKRLDKITKAGSILQGLTKQLVDNNFDYKKTYSGSIDLKHIKYMAFFLLKGCPYCAQQVKTILYLKENRPELNIEVFVKNYSKEELNELPFAVKLDNNLSDSLGFNKFPTTLIEDIHGAKTLMPGILSQDFLTSILK